MLKKLIIILALSSPFVALAQETPNVIVGPVSHQQKEADKKKAKQRAAAEKDQQKGIKQRYKMQDKETRKRMRKSRKEAERVNNNGGKGFFLDKMAKKEASLILILVITYFQIIF